jgi:hypothetical protein
MFHVNVFLDPDLVTPVTSFDTSTVPPDSNAWVSGGDPAWADPADFSWGRIELGPGSYTIAMSVIQQAVDPTGTPFPSGAGYIQATETPEPGSFLLAGVAILLASPVAFRRRLLTRQRTSENP